MERAMAAGGGDDPKALGAFYTHSQIADFLVWWAIRGPRDTVLDPSFGGGVFLRLACKRIADLGGVAAEQIHGVEIDPEVYQRIAEKLREEFGVRRQKLARSDFFDLTPGAMPAVDALVGNPPFIRYQRFTGAARRKALERAREDGVELSELSSSWAPFLVHGIAMARHGGRLAMVIPAEIGHAAYSRPVLRHLAAMFAEVTLLTFRRKLFPDLNEDTLLLLADGKGQGPARFRLKDLAHAGGLAEMMAQGTIPLAGTRRLEAAGLTEGNERLIEQHLPAAVRGLYRELRDSKLTATLGTLADVGIGYVTGANHYFHLLPEEAARWGVPARFLRLSVRRGRSLTGLRFTREDWRRAVEIGEAAYLLHLDAGQELPEAVRRYLRHGEEEGIPEAYKCRNRKPWYRVPHVREPDAFLSYMSGTTPRLVANDAGAVASNSLHVLRMHPGHDVSRDGLAVLWQTSLTRLSSEVEGHPLGGGMLKMEPTEAERVLVIRPEASRANLDGLAREFDAMIRGGRDIEARREADRVLLAAAGIGERDCERLGAAAERLRERRYGRGSRS